MTPESPGQRIARDVLRALVETYTLSLPPSRDEEAIEVAVACIDAHLAALTREVERLIAALNWALGTGNLGTGNEFAPRGPYDAPYWWRPELQRRAGLVWDGEQFVTSASDKP